jgi:SAM-dependent methyltransferase
MERGEDSLDPMQRGGRDAVAAVDAFYARHPFPGYAPGDDARTLLDRSRGAPFLAALDAALPPDATVVDCGCGTGQLAAFLALCAPRRRIVALDRGGVALACAREFRERAAVANLALVRADLFALPLRDGAFDFVVCRGVVHHTPDPERAIACVARLVAPSGVLVLGIYESAARAFHRLRRALGRLVGRPIRALDPVLRRRGFDEDKRRTWRADQYDHPLERSLALPRVVRQLEQLGFGFVRCVPPLPEGAGLFEKAGTSSRLGRAALRLGWLVSGVFDADAGLVVVVAQRERASERT